MKLKLTNTQILKSLIAFGVSSITIGGYVPVSYAETVDQKIVSSDYMMLDITSERVVDERTLTEYTRYYYSYDGMTPEEMTEKGLHVAMTSSTDGENWLPWSDVAMYALEPGTIDNYGGYIQIAIVDYPMDNLFSYKDDLAHSEKTLALSDIYSNDVDHVYELAAPHILSVTPSNKTIFEPGTYKVTAKFSEHLEEIENSDLSISSSFTNAFGLNPKISNISITNTTEETMFGKTREVSVVTFDLETDLTYGSHYANYHFQLNGVVGKESRKAPNVINFVTAYKMTQCNGVFNGVMRAEVGNDINNFDVSSYNFEPNSLTDSKVVIVKTKDGNSTARHLWLNCDKEVEKFNQLTNITIGVAFADGFDTDANYTAFRYVPQKNGSYKIIELKTEITSKGLKISGVNTLES